ncbi:MAG: DivIVA domain-containing protein [Acidimicrobiia bacterium]
MADVHRRAAASAPRLTPDEIATRGFAAAFRGLSELEVRNFLKRVADEMTTALERERSLETQITELQEQVKNPPVVTEDRLLEALGEETARVLRSAQESAEEIRSRAEARAETVTTEAEAAATATRADADQDAAAMRDAAQSAAAAREEAADTYARETRAAADAEVAELRASTEAELTAAREESTAAAAAEIEAAKAAGRELVNEARSVRERILADLGRRRMLLQAQIDELRAGRDRLLDAYRVVKRTLGDATEALVQVEARAAHELSGPAPPLEVPPVDGELAALAGELTGEAGPVSADVEALFARLREQSSPADELPPPAPIEASEPAPAGDEVIDLVAEDADAAVTVDDADAATAGAAPPPGAHDLAASAAESAPSPAAAESVDEPAGATEPAEPPDVVEIDVVEIDVAAVNVEVDVASVIVLGDDASDDDVRAARDAVIAPLHRELGRKVKRALQDEQNDVLDRIRTVKGRPSATAVLPTTADQATLLAATLRGPVDTAYHGGRIAAGASGASQAAPAPMVDGLATTMVERLHERLVEAIDGAGDDANVTQRLGARYREFKGQELDAIVGDTLAAAWALGVFDATRPGTTLRWIPSEVGRCPDCDDNALEPTPRGEAFPTGQLHPPAHPGCRCLVVPAG